MRSPDDGPGASEAIRKSFRPAADSIRCITDTQEQHFARLGLSFTPAGGQRLPLIDRRNLLCEIDKHA
ncbi:nucleotide kinase domain-containing protein [Actinoplanes sp. NPDC049316]|uniref:nucleotide kinase domain-containing protein n=1 Tax=Actinoplanes sp. NPDC049316 TaxID=3154727 RepID=UPI00341C1AAA